LAVWAVLIAALFFVTRGLSRPLAWAFVVAGLAIPVAALQVWPMGTSETCQETVTADGDSADGRYEYRIVKSQCRGSSELAYRVEMGRKEEATRRAALRPVMRSYGFPRPVAVKQVADNHFLIYLTSNGRDQVPLRISLNPETGEPTYLHRFFQGHSDRSFTVSGLTEPAEMSTAKGQKSVRHKSGKCTSGKQAAHDDAMDSKVRAEPRVSPRPSPAREGHSVSFRLILRGLLPGS